MPSLEPADPTTVQATTGSDDHWLDHFARQVQRTPAACALISGDRRIGYAELDAESNRLARRLRDAGIGRGQFVGIGINRSAELVSTLLGILKAGAAYIPIDPGYPEERISRMISSARLELVVTKSEFAGCFTGTRALCVDDGVTDSFPADPVQAPGAATDPVYAIFTSGSTGEPKAASVTHAGFANLLRWYASEFALGSGDRTLVISSPSFDLTQKNLYSPLLVGGTLVLDDNPTYDITRILKLIREHGITVINCTPSAFYPLVDASAATGFQDISSLRFAVLGGEPISIPRLRAWLENPSCRTEVVNSYGPTECTDICLFHRLHRGNLEALPFVPLGRSIPNVEVVILGDDNDPLPDGETGELCIRGAGVGGGYLHDPARTADRFVGPDRSTYRSGDLAKRLPGGIFEFRGRTDHQVKVNGFRIELGEIEIALQAHPTVREAVVTAREGRLTAHIEGDATAEELRDHLAARLPAYMAPGVFRFVGSFPLTPNGKVDRRALADLPADESPPPPPSSNNLESQVLTLWSEILGHPVNDAEANFFDLGGSSIHVAVVHVRLQEMTGRDFPITDLFARPSARSIALHLSPNSPSPAATRARDRSRLAKAGFARFQRPLKR